MTDFYNDYYEKLHTNKGEVTSIEKKRINTTINLIPENVKSLLDVGCGDGRIVNCLAGKYEKIYGLDISHNALEKVKTNKIHGSLEKLPFLDNSFDILLCTEVLEHLPYPIYKKAIKEIERVSKKYILVTVPYNENLDIRMIKCPECGGLSHEWRHLRSFDRKKLKNLFNGFEILQTKTQLAEEFMFSKTLLMMGKYLNIYKQFPNKSICPQCGYSHQKEIELTPITLKTKIINSFKKILPLRKSGGWIMVLYQCSDY